ncbi:hypothetical protein XENOCAPTIV_021812 [Xenoophorus captivus]|uniref:PX domain-containing protein n=1 Tax=Xenoophorus captivus TaxID=1517983 RepID=A0ABV0SDT8_9TELE
MASSSDRNPPPFSVSEQSEPGLSDMADGDSDDGEDIFVSNSFQNHPASVSRGVLQPEVEEAAAAKPNGVHSDDDDDDDLFAEAQADLSSDTSGSSARKDLSTSSGLPSARSPADLLPTSLEQLEEEEAKDSFDVDVAVTNPEKVGDGMNAYVAYKVSTRTSLPMFKSKAFTARRRFSDFLGLYEKLSAKQSLHGCIIPPPPEKSVVGKRRSLSHFVPRQPRTSMCFI